MMGLAALPVRDRLTSFDKKLQYWILVGLILVGLAIRLNTAVAWNAVHPDSVERLNGDEPGYDNLARDFLNGQGFTWPGRVPLYPIWLAGIYLVSNGSYNAVSFAQALLGTLTIALVYVLGSRVFNGKVGLIAALMMTVNPVHIHWSVRLYSEILYTPFLLVVALALWDAFQKPGIKNFIIAGVLVGVSNLIRPTLLFFPFFLIVVLWLVMDKRKALQYGLTFLGVSLLVVTPWVIHNYVRYNALFALQTSNGFFWLASPEYYRLARYEGYSNTRIWTEVIYGPNWRENDPTSVEGDRYWTGRAVQSIIREPLLYLRYAGEKLFTYWLGDPNADWGDTYVFNYSALRQMGYSRDEAIQVMALRAVPILALAAVLLLRRWRFLLPLYVLLLYFNLLHAAIHAEARLSDPLFPFLAILIAGAIDLLWIRFSANRGKSSDASSSPS